MYGEGVKVHSIMVDSPRLTEGSTLMLKSENTESEIQVNLRGPWSVVRGPWSI